MTKSGPGLLGINPKLATDIYPINPSTIPQQSKQLLDPLIFTSK
jgi:hypothetical protein